jgi:hypothetical protein
MKARDFLRWFEAKISNYNLFIPEEHEHVDNNDEQEDPATVTKHQKYATRLYVALLISK